MAFRAVSTAADPGWSTGSNEQENSLNIAYPTLQAGDVLYLWGYAIGDVDTTDDIYTTPTGFTSLHGATPSNFNNPVGNHRWNARLSYKIATGAESGNLTVSWVAGTFGNLKALILASYSNPHNDTPSAIDLVAPDEDTKDMSAAASPASAALGSHTNALTIIVPTFVALDCSTPTLTPAANQSLRATMTSQANNAMLALYDEIVESVDVPARTWSVSSSAGSIGGLVVRVRGVRTDLPVVTEGPDFTPHYLYIKELPHYLDTGLLNREA